MSSPLTSLSSLDDPDERQVSGLSFPSRDPEDLKVAQVNIRMVHSITDSNIHFFYFPQLLCSLQSSRKSVAAPSSSTINGFIRKTVDSGVQTEPEYVFPARTKDLKQPQSNPVTKVGPSRYHNNLSFRHCVNKASPNETWHKWIDRTFSILSERSSSDTYGTNTFDRKAEENCSERSAGTSHEGAAL